MYRKPSKFHVTESDLLCKNRCGFYGNTAWKGYCSVCYKSLSARHAQRLQHHGQGASGKTVPRAVVNSEQNFANFEEKRRQQSDRMSGTMRSLFFKSSKKDKTETHHASKTVSSRREATKHHPRTPKNEFSRFLQSLSVPIYEDMSKKVQALLQKCKSLPPTCPVDRLSSIVQDFYQHINEHINSHHLFQELEESQVNDLLDHLEMHLMNCLFNVIFCSPNSDDEQQDLHLQQRIRSLHWVTIQHLEAGLDDKDLGVRSALDKSISDITELDTKRSPKEKLKCIVDCSRRIFEALRLSALKSTEASGGLLPVASADDFLPVFIFIILKANPPRLKSNINYITRFSCPSRLNSGEGGYFFTNMCCVVDFVEKLNAESLNLTKEEFDSYMKGEAVPDGTMSVYMCDGLRIMHENSQLIKKLKERQEKCESNVKRLELRLAEFRNEFDDQINTLVQKAPLILKPRRREAEIDTNSDIPTSLPTPLLPQQLYTGD